MVKKKLKYKSIEEVPVWQKSHELTLYVYKVTRKFPRNEQCGLTSQFRRRVVSVAANMAEGLYRKSIKELMQFLYTSRGSLGEAKYYSRLSKDLGYITKGQYNKLLGMIDDIGKQLNGWIKSLDKYK